MSMEAVHNVKKSRSFNVQWLSRLDDIAALKDGWLELETAVKQRSVFSTYNWVVSWYQHYAGVRGEPLVGIAREGGQLIGIAPLIYSKRTLGKVPVSRVDFAGHDAEAGEFLVLDEAPELVGNFLYSLYGQLRFDVICLSGFDSKSETFRSLHKTAEALGLHLELLNYSYATVDLKSGYEVYCRAMSRNFRRNLKRQAERIAAAGPVKIDRIHAGGGYQELPGYLTRMFSIADLSWKVKVGGPMAKHVRGFYEDIILKFVQCRTADLAILSINGTDAAYILGFVERGVYYDVTISFNDAFKELSPGAYLMQEIMKVLPESGIHTIISHGDHEYKQRWATAFIPQSRVFIFSSRVNAILSRAIKFMLPRALTQIKRTASILNRRSNSSDQGRKEDVGLQKPQEA